MFKVRSPNNEFASCNVAKKKHKNHESAADCANVKSSVLLAIDANTKHTTA